MDKGAPKAMKNVLFLCTGNSCRSQMAEGFVNEGFSGRWMAFSAGTRPSGYVHPLAIHVMAEEGIDISENESKTPESLRDETFDLIITVCDSAAEECPVWLGQGKVTHISFPDPAEATGSYEEILQVFRSVRDDIRTRISAYLETLNDH
jgi:arsenate reductase